MIEYFYIIIVTPFSTEVSFTDGKCNWFLLLVLKSCNDELVLKLSILLNTNIFSEKICKHGTGKIFIFINHPLQEHLAPIPNILHNTFFWTINILCIVELPQNIIQYFIREYQWTKCTIFSMSVFNIWTGLLIIKETASLTNWFFLC
jgi:hypothetical protein